MRIPRSVRDLQVERESLFLDFSSQRLFHRLDLFLAQRRQQFSFRAVVSDAMSRHHQGQCHVHVLMDDCLASGQRVAPVSALQLHDHVMKVHGVIPIDSAFVSLREDHLQVPVPAGEERRSALGCGYRKAAVELGHVVVVEKLVGPVQRSDPAQTQLLRQPALPGREVPLLAASCLRRVGRDHLHSQFLHGAAYLRGTLIIDLASALGRQPEVGSTVRIQ